MCVDPKWIAKRSTICVNKHLQISYDGGDWHGSALYIYTENGGEWNMTFNWKADVERMKTVRFTSLPNTNTFLHLNEEDKRFNALLIPYVGQFKKND